MSGQAPAPGRINPLTSLWEEDATDDPGPDFPGAPLATGIIVLLLAAICAVAAGWAVLWGLHF